MSGAPANPRDNPFYARDDVAERYARSRAPPADVARTWADLLARQAQQAPALSVDLGCGTGAFTRILASTFGGRVIGLDPSRPMLRLAAEALRATPGVSLALARAEAVPLADGCADFLLMSMSYHHVPDKPAALASVRRVLRRGGVFCVRTCSVDALDSYLYQRFFPEARPFDERRFPSRQGLVEEVADAGFVFDGSATVRERVAENLRTYRDNVAARAHSDLQIISDDQFVAGLKRLDEWIASRAADGPVFHDVDLFTFSAATPNGGRH